MASSKKRWGYFYFALCKIISIEELFWISDKRQVNTQSGRFTLWGRNNFHADWNSSLLVMFQFVFLGFPVLYLSFLPLCEFPPLFCIHLCLVCDQPLCVFKPVFSCCLWQFALCYSPVFHLSLFQCLPVSPRGMFLVFCPSCFYWFEVCLCLYFVELLFLVFELLVFTLLGLLDFTFWILFLVPKAASLLAVCFCIWLLTNFSQR